MISIADVDKWVTASARWADKIVEINNGITMQSKSMDTFVSAGYQSHHPSADSADEGIRQHRYQLHHMCSASKVEIEDITFIRQSPICLLVGFKRRKREVSWVTAKLDAVDRCEATAIIDN